MLSSFLSRECNFFATHVNAAADAIQGSVQRSPLNFLQNERYFCVTFGSQMPAYGHTCAHRLRATVFRRAHLRVADVSSAKLRQQANATRCTAARSSRAERVTASMQNHDTGTERVTCCNCCEYITRCCSLCRRICCRCCLCISVLNRTASFNCIRRAVSSQQQPESTHHMQTTTSNRSAPSHLLRVRHQLRVSRSCCLLDFNKASVFGGAACEDGRDVLAGERGRVRAGA